jgi:hypothetical protein
MKKWLLCGVLVSLVGPSVVAVPSAPGNLAAVVNGNAIALTWTAPPGALGYRLDAGLTPGSTIASSTLGAVPGFTAFPIPPGTYYFRVHAFDATGISAPSNEVVAVVGGSTPGTCSGPPAPPVGLGFTVTGNAVSIQWRPGDACPNASYLLHAGSAPGLSNVVVANLGAALSIAASAPNGTYYVRLFAQNAFGTSVASSEVVITVGSAPPPTVPPSGSNANADALYNQAVVLFNAAQLNQASAVLTTLILTYPTYADAYYLAGVIALNQGNLRLSANLLRQYLALAPTGSRAAETQALLNSLIALGY